MRVGRSSGGIGVPSSRRQGSTDTKPGLPISSASGRPMIRSAARLPPVTTRLRS